MRYVGPLLISGLVAACGPSSAPGGGAAADVLATPCGESEELPAGTARDDAAHTLTVGCDAAGELALTMLDDGIVRLRYGKDDRGSIVALDRPPATTALRVGRRGNAAVLCAPKIEIAVEPGACTLTAKDELGNVILSDGAGGGWFHGQDSPLGASSTPEDVVGVVRSSPPDERIYGLGLHTAAGTTANGLDLRGTVVELFNTDAFVDAAGGWPPDAPHLYETIPFYIGLRGASAYGLFTDETRRTRFDLASEKRDRIKLTSFGTRVDQYLVAGPRIADVVRRYTRLTGRLSLPPPWALGFQQSRWDSPCDGNPSDRLFCSAPQIESVAQKFRDDGIPADGLFLDIQHLNGNRSFTWDPTRFPDPEGLSARLWDLGFATVTIVDPALKVDDAWDIYTAGLVGNHYLRSPDGKVFVGQVWAGDAAYPEFSAKDTRSWWAGLVATAARRGVRGMWIDMNEPAAFGTGYVPNDVLADGNGRPTTMAEVHNAYGYFEAQATYAGMQAARPDERPFVLSRSAFAGQQKYSAVWTGDSPSTWATLGETLPQLLHLGLSGMTFAGSDVGGYSGRAESTAELFTRWMSLGAISPFFRAHAEENARRQEPWASGTAAEDANRELISLRYTLMPYLYSAVEEASRTGAPVLRPLVYEFQEDPRTHAIADEAMLGAQLLFAPVLTANATARKVYLPAGGPWFELRSGAAYPGGTTITLAAEDQVLPANALPAFARAGAILPTTQGIEIFPAAETKTTFDLYEDDGKAKPSFTRTSFALERTATGARFTSTATHAGTTLHFRRIDRRPSAATLDGANVAFTWDANDRSVTIDVPARRSFVVELAYDATLEPESDVAVPVRVQLPAGTPTSTPISVAVSRTGWRSTPLARVGDVATGTILVPRGSFTFFKVTRGDWATVEKDAGCGEISNRPAFGSARTLGIVVGGWADRCQ
jgi:alpha-glucosidase